MNYKIIRSIVSLQDLESLVDNACREGFQPAGAPFRDEARGAWVQAVYRAGAQSSETKFREPKAVK